MWVNWHFFEFLSALFLREIADFVKGQTRYFLSENTKVEERAGVGEAGLVVAGMFAVDGLIIN
ncbi:hypothetical protein NG798_16500 [Ancylothrix sp. C2]|nr:hypothetical protein [Ancylothrix sp. D3o]